MMEGEDGMRNSASAVEVPPMALIYPSLDRLLISLSLMGFHLSTFSSQIPSSDEEEREEMFRNYLQCTVDTLNSLVLDLSHFLEAVKIYLLVTRRNAVGAIKSLEIKRRKLCLQIQECYRLLNNIVTDISSNKSAWKKEEGYKKIAIYIASLDFLSLIFRYITAGLSLIVYVSKNRNRYTNVINIVAKKGYSLGSIVRMPSLREALNLLSKGSKDIRGKGRILQVSFLLLDSILEEGAIEKLLTGKLGEFVHKVFDNAYECVLFLKRILSAVYRQGPQALRDTEGSIFDIKSGKFLSKSLEALFAGASYDLYYRAPHCFAKITRGIVYNDGLFRKIRKYIRRIGELINKLSTNLVEIEEVLEKPSTQKRPASEFYIV